MKSEYQRWVSKVEIVNDKESCWIWKGSKYRGGYGHFRRFINGRWTMGKAHRFSYEYFNKSSVEKMKGLIVCHKCDNPICVNPNHLFLGTHQDNIDDMKSKGRAGRPINPKHNNLTWEIVHKMRKLAANSRLTYKQLGKLFNTSASQAHRVVTNKTWKEN